MVDESICGGQKSPGGSDRAWRPIRTARMVAGVVGLTVVLLATLVTGVAAAPAPAAPPGLTAVLRSTGDGRNPQVVLRWDAPGSAVPVVGYNVDRNGSYYRTVPGTEFVDDVAAGETYVYEVSAFSGTPSDRGFGPKSDEVSVTVPAAADPSVPIEDPTVGGPSGKGPLLPTNLTAVAVTGDTEAVNPDGIRVSWTPGGGPESIGFNVSRNGQYLTSIMGRSWFVDCDVFAGQTYSYKVSAWSEGPEFSFSSGSAQATASVTPQECVPLTPPGPGGPDGPFEDPIFDVARDVDARPPTPQNVRIADERLQWDMPQGPRFLFQITRNSLTDRIGEMWGQFSVTSGHPDLEYAQLSDGRVRFSIPIDQFGAGDRFHISAVHPYEIPDVVPRFSERSRFATITKDGPGETIGNFLTTFGTDELPSGSWIGSRDDWNPVAQFSDEFNDGSGLLVDRENPGWFFARSDGPTEISPSPLRDQTQTDRRAVRKDGKLEMSAGLDDGSYSYIGTADNNGNGYFVDPTNGVFVEASVRLDRMTPADNAWWAFWLMTPGTDACTAGGGPAPNGFNAYDGHARTGMEIDIFEFVPDLDNGFNQALFTYDPDNRPEGCDTLDRGKLSPFGKNFTYEGGDLPGVDMPNYMDGDYHRLGMYYAQDCYAFYIDDELIWKVTEAEHPGWITDRARESIRLTWEIQNPRITSGGDQINNPWTSQGGDFANSAIDQDPTVSIDFVNVWEKKESANGLCSGGPDPEPTTDPEPDPESNPGPETQPALAAPVDVAAVSTNEGIEITWQPGAGVEADGYDISRNGEGYWSVEEAEFVDESVVAGETYTYAVTPWLEGPGGDRGLRTYGDISDEISATVGRELPPVDPNAAPGIPTDLEVVVDGRLVTLSWSAATGPVEGYQILRRSGVGPLTVVANVEDGSLRWVDRPSRLSPYGYSVRSYTAPRGPDQEVTYSAYGEVVEATPTSEPTTNPNPDDFGPIGVPAEVTARVVGPAVHLSWNDSSGPVWLYRVFRDGSEIPGSPFRANNIADNNAEPGEVHSYQIQGVGRRPSGDAQAAASELSTPATATVPVGTEPLAGLSFFLNSSATFGSITLSGSSLVAIKGYDVYRDGELIASVLAENRDPGPIGIPSLTRRIFSDEDVTPGVTYDYYVTPWATVSGKRRYGATTMTSSVTAEHDPGDTPFSGDPDLAEVEVTGDVVNTVVSLTWNRTNADGYRVVRRLVEPTDSFYGIGSDYQEEITFTTETEHVDKRELDGLFGMSGLAPETAYTYEVTPYADAAPRRYGRPATIVVTTGESFPQPAVTDVYAFPSIDPLTQEASVTVQWRAPQGWETGGVTAYRISHSADVTRTLFEADMTGTVANPDLRSYTFGPIGPDDRYYERLIRPDYELGVQPYRMDLEPVMGRLAQSQPSHGFWPDSLVAMPDPPEGKEHPGYANAIDELFPDATEERRAVLTRLFWRLHLRVLNGYDPSSFAPRDPELFADHGLFLRLLEDEGYEAVLGAGWDLRILTHDLGSKAAPAGLHAFIPGQRMSGDRAIARNRNRLGRSLTSLGWTRQGRSDRYFENLPVLEGMLQALPDPPKSSSQVERIEILAFWQAKLLLDVQPRKRSYLWSARRYVEGGHHPTRTVHLNSDDRETVSAPTPFSRLWNAASEEDRLAYYGFDPTGWELALPFITLSKDMDRIQDKLKDWWTPLIKGIIGAAIVYVTGGAASAAYASYFGVSATGLGASAFGAFTGTLVSTLFMTNGDLDAAIESAWRAMLTAGVTHYTAIPAADRSTYQVFAIAILEGGLARLNGESFQKALLASLAEHYVPGLASFLEDLDNVSPFFAGLGGVLIKSYIENNGDWDEMSSDLEQYAFDYVGEGVTNYVGGKLKDANWGSLGDHVADLAGLAVSSGGDEDLLRAEVFRRLGDEMGENVRKLFGDNDSFGEDFAAHLVDTYLTAQGLGDDEKAKFFDDEMSRFIFERAGEKFADEAKGLMVSANGGRSSALIDSLAGLIDVAVSNSWKSQEELEAAIATYVANELKDAISAAVHNDCSPEWINGLTDQLVDSAVDSALSGDSDQVGQNVGNYLIARLQSGELDSAARNPAACQDAQNLPEAGSDEPGNEGVGGDPGSCDVVLAGAPAAAVAVPNGALGAGFGPSRRHSSLVASGLVSRSVAPDQCGSAQQFARWLIGLQSFQMDRIVSSSSTGSTVVRAVDEALGFDAFSLVILDGESFGLVYRDNGGLVGQPLSIYVGVERDGRGDVVNFTEFDVPDGFDVFFDGLSGDALRVVSSFIDGCASSVGENLEAMKAAVLELWNSENIVAYLVDKWEEIEEILDAFDSDPAAFVEQFLRDLVRDEEFGQDRARWAGLITCDVALAVLLAAVPGATAGPLARLLDRLPEIRRFESDPDRDADSVIGPPCSTNSFPTGTLVLMADGSRRPIDGIDPGDWVLAADETSGVWSSREVLDQWSYQDQGQMATVTLADGSQVTATDHHEFWVASDGAWLELEDVQAGDWLLTPDGLTEVVRVDVSAVKSTLVWELDVAIDDTFAVFTGTTDVLVHNASTCFGAHAEPQGYDGRSFEELMPNGFVPASGAFNQWWDDLSVSEFDYLVLNGQIRERMIARIRGDEPNHEWCMCSLMGYFKKNWDISMAEIRAFVTPTGDVRGTVPDDRYGAGYPAGTPWAHPTSGFGNSIPSKDFHDELEQLIFESDTKSDFARDLPALLTDWGVPASVVPIPDW